MTILHIYNIISISLYIYAQTNVALMSKNNNNTKRSDAII